MSKLILSYPESLILGAVDDEANTHQLSSSTRLVPSDVSKTVSQLADRNLLVLEDGTVRLTKVAQTVRRKLDMNPSSSTSDVIVVDMPQFEYDTNLLSTEELNQA